MEEAQEEEGGGAWTDSFERSVFGGDIFFG